MPDSPSPVTKKKTTKLHAWHLDASANMAQFGDYEMPMWYPAGVRGEHLSALTAAGLFDTSHMAALILRGENARELLQTCFTRDLDACLGSKPLPPGRCVYGVFLNTEGGVIDDAIVYMLAEDTFMVVVNAGMGSVVKTHLEAHHNSAATEIIDWTDVVGKLDLQGPAAAKILSRLLESPGSVFEKLPYFSFKGRFCQGDIRLPGEPVRLRSGMEILISRSGYTGEFGFEIFTAGEDFISLWEQIMTAGKPLGLLPCGLAARDSLRTGAGLPLSHQDIGPWTFVRHPWEFTLPYNADKTGFSKSFLGDQALLAAVDAPWTIAYIGNDLRKVTAGPDTRVRNMAGDDIGHVLSCATDVGIGRQDGRVYSVASPTRPEGFRPKGLACGFLQVREKQQPGNTVTLIDQRRKIDVTITDGIRPDRTARRPIREFI